MKKIDRPTQLNLFVVSGQSGALIESTCDSIDVHLNSIQVDIEALRGELLSWGAKHRYPCFGFPYMFPPTDGDADRRYGGLPHGLMGWKREIAYPSQQDRYPGEWLTKAIEQIKRYDLGVYDIPEQIMRISDDTE